MLFLLAMPTYLPDNMMPRCRARDEHLLSCHWMYVGSGGEMGFKFMDLETNVCKIH